MGILNLNLIQVRNDSVPLVNGKLYTYESETYIPKETYYDVNLTVPAPNPLVADSNGIFPQFYSGGGLYRIVIKDGVTDETLIVRDNLSSLSDGLEIPTSATFLGVDGSGALYDSTSAATPIISAQIVEQVGYIGSFNTKALLDEVIGTDGQWATVKDSSYGRIVYWWNVSTSEWVRRSGGSIGTEPYNVKWIDCDGTILKEEYVVYGAYSTPPSTPSLDSKLTFSGWIGPDGPIRYHTVYHAMYYPTDGWNHYGIVTPADNHTDTFEITKSDTSSLTVDFGDGSSTILTASGRCSFSHTWATSGAYDVRIKSPTNAIWCEGYAGSNQFITTSKTMLRYIWFQKDRLTASSVGPYSSPAAFVNCKRLKYVISPMNLVGWVSSFGDSSTRASSIEVFTDSATTSGAKGLFNGCRNLRHIATSKFVDYSIDYFLRNCSMLESWVAPSLKYISVTNPFNETDSITSLSIDSFISGYLGDMRSLEYLELPNATELNSGSVRYASMLKSVNAPLLTAIGQSSFTETYSLTSVNMPKLVVLAAQVFLVSNTRSIELNDITYIGSGGFSESWSLSSVVIGPNITSFGNAFENCYNLSSLTIKAVTPPSVLSSFLSGRTAKLKIYVPAASVAAYKSAWTDFSSNIFPIGS